MHPASRSRSSSVSSIASTSSATSDTARSAPHGEIAVAPEVAGDKPMTIPEEWIAAQKKNMNAYQRRILDYALDAMQDKPGTRAIDPHHNEGGGDFRFTRPAGPGKHATSEVRFGRDPDNPTKPGYISVSKVNDDHSLTPVVQAGEEPADSDSEDARLASPSAASSRRSSDAGSNAASPVRRHSASSIQSLLARLSGSSPSVSSSNAPSAPLSPMRLDDDREGQGGTQSPPPQVAGQKRGRLSPPHDGRLVDGQRPASSAASDSRPASIHHHSPPAAETPLPGADFSASPRETSSAAGTPPRSPGTAGNPIDVSIASIPPVIDLTRATPGPSTATALPAAPADETAAPAIQRQTVTDKKAFESQRLACLSDMVKYFSDRDLAGLTRDGSIELLTQRAQACGATRDQVDETLRNLHTWLSQSKEAIADLRDDDPLFFNANGKPTTANMIQYIRSTRCGGVQPMAIRPSEELVRANWEAEKRFKRTITDELGLDPTAGTMEVDRASQTKRHCFNTATSFTRWATDNKVNITTLRGAALEALRKQYAIALLSDGSEPADGTIHNRKGSLKPFTDFLAIEYAVRQRAAAGDGEAAALPGTNPA